MKPLNVFSQDRRYRYTLWRLHLTRPPDLFAAQPDLSHHGPSAFIQWIGLNPSTADEIHDDPTLRRCMDWSASWGFDAMVMTNLFAFRASDPEVMHQASSPEGEENDAWLVKCGKAASRIILAWGDGGEHLDREQAVRTLLLGNGLLAKAHTLGRTKAGNPTHPMARGRGRLPKQLETKPWHP